MGKTLKYGEFEFPKGNRIAVRPHTRVRAAKKTPPKMQTGGVVEDPNARVYGALNQARPPSGESARAPFGGGPGIGSGSMSETARLTEALNRGHAPLTAKGVMQAVGNALGVIGSGAVMTGLKSATELAAGEEPGTYGGISNIEGNEAFDPSVQAAVKSGQVKTMAQAIAMDKQLKAASQGERSSTGQVGPGGGRGTASNTPSGRDKPGPGGLVRARGGRIGRRRF